MANAHLTMHQIPGSRTLTLYCGHCTGALHLALPVPLTELVEAGRQWTARHGGCREKLAEPVKGA